MKPDAISPLGRFATRHALSITFIAAALCLAGIFCALRMPSSVFPQTNFPRVVIIVNNGIMPADEMMATVTRPIEEALKDIPGAVTVRSATKRGSAQINVFFNWNVDMAQSELYVLGRLSQIRSDLPATASTEIERVTFSAFPIIGISLTSSNRDITSLWETANYELKPRFLQIPGVARVEITGGRAPEYHVVVDPLKLQANGLGLADVSDALTKNNLFAPAGMMEENYHLYLTTVDGRVHSAADIENLVIAVRGGHPVQIRDVARVERGPEPVFQIRDRARPRRRAAEHPEPGGRQHAGHRHRAEKTIAATPAGIAAGHAPRVFLRPIAFRARFGGQRVGRDCFRADSVAC